MDRAPRISWGRAVAGSRWWNKTPSAVLPSAPKRSACATMSPPASRATIFRRAGRFPSPSSAPKARSKMSAPAGIGESSNYFSRFFALVRLSLTQLVRPPSQPQRAEAARRGARQLLLLAAIGGAVAVVLMFEFDVTEIGLMPRRGTPSLWPIRIVTNFGEAAFV